MVAYVEHSLNLNTSPVNVTVELFGSARLASGQRAGPLAVPGQARRSDVARVLASACPELRGVAITEDGSDLAPSYTFNLNGKRFVANERVTLAEGDTLLLFSSLAGG